MSPTSPADSVIETEQQLVHRAQEALSQCRWVVGECAAQWTIRYARGRTDADFGAQLGLSGDQVYQRRRVWECFAEIRDQYKVLKWSHFYAALTWDDAQDCLQWAEETQSTVAEMKAWRRAQRGEDLSEPPPFADGSEAVRYLPTESAWVQVPGEGQSGGLGGSRGERGGSGDQEQPALTGVARQFDPEGNDYSPYRQGAGLPAPQDEPASRRGGDAEPPSTEQLVRRMASTVERCVKVLTPEFAQQFRRLPEADRNRFLQAVGELNAKVADLQ